MAIFIQNSLSKKKEEFIPFNPQKVNIYSCGVTVYDDCHIGHARSLYIFEVIRRYFKYRGFAVNFVRNITDIDDKIINRANELKIDWKQLVDKYIDGYYKDLAVLGLGKADFEPRATENIPEMIKFIQGLIDKGYAYPTSTGVYFSVRKFEPYGQLSGQGIEQMLTGVRKDADETKEDPLDFALWKTSKPGEPFWESPWGDGRPGWHIECSVMSTKFLKTSTLDIHAGGRDLIFPHHENEIAQAEALTGKPFAKYWIHHGLLTINGQKMSKSLGNFITIKDAIGREEDNNAGKRKFNENVLKLFFLSSHYSSPIDYSEDRMIETTKRFRSFVLLFEEFRRLSRISSEELTFEQKKNIDDYKERFISVMDDDFNTPQALAVLEGLLSFASILKVNAGLNVRLAEFKYAVEMINDLMKNIFVIDLEKTDVQDPRLATEASVALKRTVKNAWVDEKRKQRELLKKEKKYKEADEIRKEIEQLGYEILDNNDGSSIVRPK